MPTGTGTATFLSWLVDDDIAVGFCHFAPTRDEDAGPATGEVRAIYLRVMQRRLGGAALLLAAAAQGTRCGRLSQATLWVLEVSGLRRSRFRVARHSGHDHGECAG